MSLGFLLTRLLLRFDSHIEDLMSDISAAALTPDGSLWVGSDELLAIERLSQVEPFIFAKHKRFFLNQFLDLFNTEDEIDIEGMDYSQGYLWFTGSHGTKRNKPKGKKEKKDIERLSEIKTDLNRYLLARIPVINGELVKSCSLSDSPNAKLTAACLQKTDNENILMEVLKEDPHLAPFLALGLPSKDNGFDIEGLAVHGDKVFLGLRGPVLRGWAIILELEVEEKNPGVLTLKEIGPEGERYKKHFVNLNGLGVRELCLLNGDMLILAGPTMDLEGRMSVFCLKDILNCSENTLSDAESGNLEVLFELPFVIGSDHAEGLALFPCLGEGDSLLVVYDSPNPNRKLAPNEIFADVFRLRSS
ncbi:MAG: DUF3616 domain-containing protein [Halothece sp.]